MCRLFWFICTKCKIWDHFKMSREKFDSFSDVRRCRCSEDFIVTSWLFITVMVRRFLFAAKIMCFWIIVKSRTVWNVKLMLFIATALLKWTLLSIWLVFLFRCFCFTNWFWYFKQYSAIVKINYDQSPW